MTKTITETKKLIYEIESYGKKYQVTPKLGLYTVYDWEDKERYGLGICLDRYLIIRILRSAVSCIAHLIVVPVFYTLNWTPIVRFKKIIKNF